MKDSAITQLKEIGLKVTPQRRAILKFLTGNRTHPSAESIYRELVGEYPGISFATVYNTLSKLVAAGKIQELDVDPNKKRFDPCVAPHHHFYCNVCGEVFDIVQDLPFTVEANPPNITKVNGHQVDAIQLNFRGVCKDCTRKQKG